MSGTFLERNKKKSFLAALLLFLRKRKILVLLLLLLLTASTVFLSPSSWVTGFPGGERFAAGVAWIAGKMGFDVSKWGLGPGGRHSYGDLLAAFRAAKSGSGGGGVGWGAFFGHGAPSGGASGDAPNSLDFVKGSKSDLEHGTGPGAQSVAGIVDPADPKNKGADGVAIAEGDLGGEREGFLKEAFAGGFMSGLFGGGGTGGAGAFSGRAGGGGAAALSGGAYATKGFFGGPVRASRGGLAYGSLAALSPVSVPAGRRVGAAHGSLSAMASSAMLARAMQSALAAGAIGSNHAYTQLAEGSTRADLGTTYCKADCPPEYAATNTGAIYDGSSIMPDFLTSSYSGTNSLINFPVNVPSDNAAGSSSTDLATKTQYCANLVGQCARDMSPHITQMKADEDQMETWSAQMSGACGDYCNCAGCHNLKTLIDNRCEGDFKNQLAATSAPCPLPSYCSGLNTPTGVWNGDPSPQACEYNTGECGCPNNECSSGPIEWGKCRFEAVVTFAVDNLNKVPIIKSTHIF